MTTLAAPVVTPLAITGAGVVSSAGLGLDALGNLLYDGGRGTTAPDDGNLGEFPPMPLRLVSDNLVLDTIGRKGLRYVDRLTTLGLTACQLALSEAGAPAADDERARTGIVMGTATGSIRSAADVAQDTLLQEKPYLINPGRFPNTVMNSCAGQIAIRNNLHGVNSTIANGALSSLAAVRYARMALTEGRADRLLVGGIEELSVPMAWAWHFIASLADQAPVGEGCAMFMVESRDSGRPALAEILACEVGFHGAATSVRRSLADGLAACVTRAVERSGVGPESVADVAVSSASHVGLARIERRAIAAALGAVPNVIDISEALGECYSAGGALQLAALLATWRRFGRPGQVGLVTSAGRDGNVGCLVVRNAA